MGLPWTNWYMFSPNCRPEGSQLVHLPNQGA
jgi:hypothetical protein